MLVRCCQTRQKNPLIHVSASLSTALLWVQAAQDVTALIQRVQPAVVVLELDEKREAKMLEQVGIRVVVRWWLGVARGHASCSRNGASSRNSRNSSSIASQALLRQAHAAAPPPICGNTTHPLQADKGDKYGVQKLQNKSSWQVLAGAGQAPASARQLLHGALRLTHPSSRSCRS